MYFVVPTVFFLFGSALIFFYHSPSSLNVKSFHQRCNYVYIGSYTIFNIYFLSSAQRKRPHAFPQTAECTDSTGLPQTPAGRSCPKPQPSDAPGAHRLILLLFVSLRSSWSTSEMMT